MRPTEYYTWLFNCMRDAMRWAQTVCCTPRTIAHTAHLSPRRARTLRIHASMSVWGVHMGTEYLPRCGVNRTKINRRGHDGVITNLEPISSVLLPVWRLPLSPWRLRAYSLAQFPYFNACKAVIIWLVYWLINIVDQRRFRAFLPRLKSFRQRSIVAVDMPLCRMCKHTAHRVIGVA
jgi:hypothetical protein